MTAQKISTVVAKRLVTQQKAILLDLRSPVAFRDGTIPGAINVSMRNISMLFKISRDTPIILFGMLDDDPDINVVANYALQLGFTKVFNLGSFKNWK